MEASLIKLKLGIKKYFITIKLYCEHSEHWGNKNFKKFIANELMYTINGDERDNFEKLIHKCRILRLNTIIYNIGGGGC